MKHAILGQIVLAGAICGLAACSTPYQEMGLLGGVSATRIDEHSVQIQAQGNAYTSAADVQNFVMLRAADECVKDGYDGFQIMGVQNTTSGSETPGFAGVYRNTAIFVPPSYIPMPSGIATIIMLKRDDPRWATGQTFAALEVEKYLGPMLRPKG